MDGLNKDQNPIFNGSKPPDNQKIGTIYIPTYYMCASKAYIGFLLETMGNAKIRKI